jgi:fucose permease
MGLFPDGASSQSGVDPEGRVGLSSQEARRTSTFWILIAAVVLLGGSVHACVIHLAAMLSDQGITAQTAALASSIAGAGLLTGRVGTGFLLDRFFGPRLAIYFSSGAALGLILLLTTHGGLMTFSGAFLVGLGMGSEGDMIAYFTSRYFGLRSFGEIYGFTFGSYVLAGAGGAFLMGFGFDRTGSYTVPLLGFTVAILVSIVLFSRLGPYRYTAHQPSEKTAAKSHLAAAAR